MVAAFIMGILSARLILRRTSRRSWLTLAGLLSEVSASWSGPLEVRLLLSRRG